MSSRKHRKLGKPEYWKSDYFPELKNLYSKFDGTTCRVPKQIISCLN